MRTEYWMCPFCHSPEFPSRIRNTMKQVVIAFCETHENGENQFLNQPKIDIVDSMSIIFPNFTDDQLERILEKAHYEIVKRRQKQ